MTEGQCAGGFKSENFYFLQQIIMKSESLDQANNKEDQKAMPLCDGALINVKVSDILTPVTCAFVINEILQGLLYQKSQIPYPYSWLKSVVDKKRVNSTSEETSRKINFNAANHFRVVSKAYDTLENIMKGIIKMFNETSDWIKEVVFIFGATPLCPKEIYTIKISSLAKGHIEGNHSNHLCKCRQKILRYVKAYDNCLYLYMYIMYHFHTWLLIIKNLFLETYFYHNIGWTQWITQWLVQILIYF